MTNVPGRLFTNFATNYLPAALSDAIVSRAPTQCPRKILHLNLALPFQAIVESIVVEDATEEEERAVGAWNIRGVRVHPNRKRSFEMRHHATNYSGTEHTDALEFARTHFKFKSNEDLRGGSKKTSPIDTITNRLDKLKIPDRTKPWTGFHLPSTNVTNKDFSVAETIFLRQRGQFDKTLLLDTIFDPQAPTNKKLRSVVWAPSNAIQLRLTQRVMFLYCSPWANRRTQPKCVHSWYCEHECFCLLRSILLSTCICS